MDTTRLLALAILLLPAPALAQPPDPAQDAPKPETPAPEVPPEAPAPTPTPTPAGAPEASAGSATPAAAPTPAAPNKNAAAAPDVPAAKAPEADVKPEPGAIVEGGEGREIGGHWYVTPFAGQTAIVATSFAFRQGIAATGADVGNVRIQFYGYEQGLRLQVGIVNRVALEAEVSGSANVAGTPDTLLAIAGLGSLRAGGGAKVRLFTWDPAGLQAAIGAGAYYTRNVVISPRQWIEQSIDQGQVLPADSAILQASGLLVTPYFALTAGRGPVGVQASVTPAVALVEGETTVGLELAAQLEIDLGRVSPVPLALVGGYSRQAATQEDQGPAQQVSAGLWYSGRRAFSIGLLGFYAFQDVAPEVTLTAPGGAMAFQYFW